MLCDKEVVCVWWCVYVCYICTHIKGREVEKRQTAAPPFKPHAFVSLSLSFHHTTTTATTNNSHQQTTRNFHIADDLVGLNFLCVCVIFLFLNQNTHINSPKRERNKLIEKKKLVKTMDGDGELGQDLIENASPGN